MVVLSMIKQNVYSDKEILEILFILKKTQENDVMSIYIDIEYI